MKKSVAILLSVSIFVTWSQRISAQTTLSGDHIITGDLNVGNSTTKGSLIVNGETGSSASPGLTVNGDGGISAQSSGGGTQRFLWVPTKGTLIAGESYFGVMMDLEDVGDYSVMFGSQSYATGTASSAMGASCYAIGYSSIAMGQDSTAVGSRSFAVGHFASAFGNVSTAFGYFTTADSYGSVAIGQFNEGGGNSSAWEEEDPVFEIGNGTGDEADPSGVQFRNAFTVYKNGDVKMTAKVTMPRQGDIPMGDFGNPEE